MATIASFVVPTSLFRWCPRSLFLLTQAKIIILIRRPKVSGLRSGQQLLEISEVLHNSCHPLPGKNCSTTCRVIVNILPATSNRRPTHNVRQQGGVLSHASGRAEVGMIQQLRSHTHQPSLCLGFWSVPVCLIPALARFFFLLKDIQYEMKPFKNLSHDVLFSPVGWSLSLQGAFIYTLYTGHIICK